MATYSGPATVLLTDGTLVGEVTAELHDEWTRHEVPAYRWGGTLSWNRPDRLPDIDTGERFILRLTDGREGQFSVRMTHTVMPIDRGGFRRAFEITGRRPAPFGEPRAAPGTP
jgi:hypothetical protein